MKLVTAMPEFDSYVVSYDLNGLLKNLENSHIIHINKSARINDREALIGDIVWWRHEFLGVHTLCVCEQLADSECIRYVMTIYYESKEIPPSILTVMEKLKKCDPLDEIIALMKFYTL